jgi:hypothetical protein
MIKNIVQPFVSSLINELTPAGEGAAYFGGGFANQMAANTSSLIDSTTVTSGTANIYGNIYSGYGQGQGYYHGSRSPSTIDLADGVTHGIESMRQHNNKFEFTLGANSAQYSASLNPAGGVTNSDAAAFKTVKFYNTSSNALVLTLERADIPYSPFSRTGFVNGSTMSLTYPSWKQTTGEAGNYFANQTIRVELWS